MSFDTYELSVEAGSPTELYKFNYGQTLYRYCSNDGGGVFEYLGEVYQPAAIEHPGHRLSEDISGGSFEISVPRDFPLVTLYIQAPPEDVITVTVLSLHLTDEDAEYIINYKGRALSASLKDDEAVIVCESIFSSLKRPGLRRTYDTQCTHPLYRGGCKLVKSAFQTFGTVLDATRTQVIIQEAADNVDNWFKGGQFECGDVRRVITASSGVVLTLMHPVPPSVIGQPCKIYPGCDHTPGEDGCSKFNNIINFGGQPWIPEKNPYTGDTIFW